MGHVVPYVNGGAINKDAAFDQRATMRGSFISSQGVSSSYYYQNSSSQKQDRSAPEPERVSMQARQIPQPSISSKVAPDIAINIDTNPFFMTRAGINKPERSNDQVAIDANLLQAKAQYGGIGAAAHRRFGTVQYGATRML